jgi:CBS domain-containing protein
MIKVKDILDKKGRQFYFVSPDNTVYEALEMMASKDVGALMVVSNDRLVGMLSERDYSRKIILRGLSSKSSKVGDLMSKEVIGVNPESTIDDCMALMTGKRIRHLPVLEKDKIMGLISIGDVVNAIIQDQHIIIKDLENYIYGGRF